MSLPIQIRISVEEDASLLTGWISEPDVLRWFPMSDQREIDDAVKIWISYLRMQSSFTADYEGTPAGMAVLYLQAYQRISHSSLFAIIVDAKYRNLGIGRALIEHLEKVAREKFHLQLLHLEVYEGNPAIYLYQKLGFKEYGRHPHFIKDGDTYICKVLMQKDLS